MKEEELTGLYDRLDRLIEEIQTLTGGSRNDLAFNRQTRFQSLEARKITISASTGEGVIQFSEPVTQVTVCVSQMGTASVIYTSIEGRAGTDSIELNSSVRVLSFGDVPIQNIYFKVDAGTTTVVQAFALRGG